MADIAFLAALKRCDAAVIAAIVDTVQPERLAALCSDFPTFSHDGQEAPHGAWRNWVLCAGRGFGKTRAGAEWIWSLVRVAPVPLRIALVGATVDEARQVMVEGPSGIMELQPLDQLLKWQRHEGLIEFQNGTKARLFSGAHGDALRGPEHHYAWCDELAKWKQGESAWNNLQMGLRAGEHPQCLVTTTPRTTRLMKLLRALPDTIETRGPTMANPHLPGDYIAAMAAQYGGTRLALQELEGVMLTDVEGSLWDAALLERCRISPLPSKGGDQGVGASDSERATSPTPNPVEPLGPVRGTGPSTLRREGLQYARIVIGVDPPASAKGVCGIVVAGLARGGARKDDVAHVLADRSIGGASPDRWARAIVDAAAEYGADWIVAEGNQGGDMVRSVLLAANPVLPVHIVHATKSKSARAEPVAALFRNGRAFFAGHFAELEEQLAGMVPGGDYQGPGQSPDRADAMVWALHELMLKPQGEPRIYCF